MSVFKMKPNHYTFIFRILYLYLCADFRQHLNPNVVVLDGSTCDVIHTIRLIIFISNPFAWTSATGVGDKKTPGPTRVPGTRPLGC